MMPIVNSIAQDVKTCVNF